jgi:hypothetical protein
LTHPTDPNLFALLLSQYMHRCTSCQNMFVCRCWSSRSIFIASCCSEQ